MAKVDVGVDLFYSSAWHNITGTDDVYTRDPIQIVRDRTQSRLTTTIENRDSRYSPRNPSSALYGLIDRNTPIRTWVRLARDTFTRTEASGWGTSETQPYGTALVWAGFASGGSTTASSVNGTQGIHSVTTTASYRGQWTSAALIYTDVTVGITVSLADSDITGGALEPATILLRQTTVQDYYECRVSIGTNEAVTATIYSVVANVETSLGSAVVAGLTHTASQSLRVIAQVEGETVRMKVFNAAADEPETWAVTVQSRVWKGPGGVGIRSGVAAGNTNTKPIIFTYDNLDVLSYRFHGEVWSWPQRWNTKGNDGWVPIEAFGIKRRLFGPGVTRAPVSALYLAIVGVFAAEAPDAYWPLETGPASGLAGRAALSTTGTIPYGTGPVAPGSGGGADFSYGGRLSGPTGLAGSAVASWEAELVVGTANLPTNKAGANIRRVASFYTPGSAVIEHGVTVAAVDETTWDFGAYYSVPGSSTIFYSSLNTKLIPGHAYHVRLLVEQNGANMDMTVFVDGVIAAASGQAGTVTQPKTVVLNEPGDSPNPSADLTSVSHLGVWSPARAVTPDNAAAAQGNPGQTAGDRLADLCAEAGIAFTIHGDADETESMGPQLYKPIPELLQDCEDADGGLLYDARTFLGLTYRTFRSMYNQTATLALTYGAAGEIAPPLYPDDTLDGYANDITVRRYGGGSARAVRETGSGSVEDPPDGVGRIPAEVELLLAEDAQAQSWADWFRAIGGPGRMPGGGPR